MDFKCGSNERVESKITPRSGTSADVAAMSSVLLVLSVSMLDVIQLVCHEGS